VCGPGPRLNFVRVVPSGCWIVKETVVGLPAATLFVGSKPTTFVTRAGEIVGALGVELPPPQPAAPSVTASSSK
jgi:hypothetical protein